MKRLIVLHFFIFISASAFSQYNWGQQTSNTSEQLYRLSFVNNFEGYAAGANGVIRKTLNGGQAWGAPLASPSTATPAGLHFDNVTTGYWVSQYCDVYKTTNGGDNWFNIYPGWSGVYAVCMERTISRLFIGRDFDVLYSEDNGSSWDSTSTNVSGYMNGLSFADDDHGFLCTSDGKVAKSTNGGLDWTPTASFPTVNGLYDIRALTPNIVVVCGEGGEIHRSVDGGDSWSPVSSGSTQSLIDMDFANGTHGIIVAANDIVIETIDGGITWNPVPTGSASTIWIDVICMNETTAYICGSGGEIWKSPVGFDVCEIEYIGPDTVCAGVPFDFEFQFKNCGPSVAQDPQFQVFINTNSAFGTSTFQGLIDTGVTVTHIPGTTSLNAGTNNVIIFATEQFVQANNTLNFNIVAVDPMPTNVDGATFFCPGDTVELTASGGDSYYWLNDVNSNDLTAANQTVYPIQTTTYKVEVNQEFCDILDSVTVTLDPGCDTTNIDTTQFNPTNSFAFSPNFDGVNDVLILDFLDPNAEFNRVTIYNRWGDEIFKTFHYDNDQKVWAGEYNEKPSPAGTYFFISESTATGVHTGWIQLVK